jgi:hypothetical protein
MERFTRHEEVQKSCFAGVSNMWSQLRKRCRR